MTRAILSFVLCFAVGLVPAVSAAQAAPGRVLVIAPENSRPLLSRLEGELKSRGFGVATRRLDGDVSTDELEQLARQTDSMAAIHLRPKAGRLQIWVVDRVTDKIVIRSLERDANGEDAGLLARRAVEVLRASLLELDAIPAERIGVQPPRAARDLADTARPAELAPPPSGRWSLVAGFGALWATGNIGATLQSRLGVLRRLSEHAGVGVSVFLPVASGDLEVPQGVVRLSVATVKLSAPWSLSPGSSSRVLLTAAPTIAAGLVETSGDAGTGFIGRDDTTFVGLAGLEGAVELQVADRISLSATGELATSLRTVRVDVAGDEVATWGRLVVSGVISLRVALD